MPFVVSLVLTLLGGLAEIIGPLAMRVLLALGMQFVTYTGSVHAVDWVLDAIRDGSSSMSSEVAGLLGYLWIDKGISLMFGAFTAALAVKAVNGSISRMVLTGGGTGGGK